MEIIRKIIEIKPKLILDPSFLCSHEIELWKLIEFFLDEEFSSKLLPCPDFISALNRKLHFNCLQNLINYVVNLQDKLFASWNQSSHI